MENMSKYKVRLKHLFAASKMVVFCFILLATTTYSPVYANTEELPQQKEEQIEKKDDGVKKRKWFTASGLAVGIAGAATTGIGQWLYNKIFNKPLDGPYDHLKKFKSDLARSNTFKRPRASLLASTTVAGSSHLTIAPRTYPQVHIPTIIGTDKKVFETRTIRTNNVRANEILEELYKIAEQARQAVVDGSYEGLEHRLDAPTRLHVVLNYDMQRLFLLTELIDIINQNKLNDEDLLAYVCALGEELEEIFSYGFSICPEAIIGVFINSCMGKLKKDGIEEFQLYFIPEGTLEEKPTKEVLFLNDVANLLTSFITSAKPTTRIPRSISNIDLSLIIEDFAKTHPKYFELLELLLRRLVKLPIQSICAIESRCDASKGKTSYLSFLSRSRMLLAELLKLHHQSQFFFPQKIESPTEHAVDFAIEDYDLRDYINLPFYREVKELYLKTLTEYYKRYFPGDENLKAIVLNHKMVTKLHKIIKDTLRNRRESDFSNRMMVMLTENFVQLICEALSRTKENLGDIKRYILRLDEGTMLHINKVDISSKGDPHQGGKRVLFISFEEDKPQTGGKPKHYEIVYKPTSLAVDAMLAGDVVLGTSKARFDPAEASTSAAAQAPSATAISIPSILREYTASLSSQSKYKLPAYSILSYEDGRGKYGFMEKLFQDSKDFITTTTESENFFYNLGRILAEAVLFGIYDRHEENFIFGKKMLMFIDLETCFYRSKTQKINILFAKYLDLLGSWFEERGISPLPNEVRQGFIDFLTVFAKGDVPDIKSLISAIPKPQQSNLIARFVPTDTKHLLGMRDEFFIKQGEGGTLTSILETFEEKIFPVFSQFRDKAVNPGSEMLPSDPDTLMIRFLVLIMLNKESILDDIARGDIPYFYTNIITGELFDSRGKLLNWSEVTLEQIESLFDTKENKELTEAIYRALSEAKAPLEQIADGIKTLQEQYKIHGNIKDCDIYQQNAFVLTQLFRHPR